MMGEKQGRNLEAANRHFRELEKSGYHPEDVNRTVQESTDIRRQSPHEQSSLIQAPKKVVRHVAVILGKFGLFELEIDK